MTTEDNTTNPFLEHIIRILRENPQKRLYTLDFSNMERPESTNDTTEESNNDQD